MGKFLVRSPIIAHKLGDQTDAKNATLGDKVNVSIGEVLKCDEIIKKKWKMAENGGGHDDVTVGDAAGATTEFLLCSDVKRNKLLVSVAHPGKFSPIFDKRLKDKNVKNVVYQAGDLLGLGLDFPFSVRLAFGCLPRLPRIPRTFQGVLQLQGTVRPDTVVMCSLVDNQLPLIEVPLNADVTLRVDELTSRTLRNSAHLRALKRCYATVYPFLTSIKLFDVKYSIRNDENEVTSGKATGATRQGRMSAPVDMSKFSPFDVFPPLIKPEDISETWALSFCDPELENATQLHGNDVKMLLVSDVNVGANGGFIAAARGRENARAAQELKVREADC